ncbi:MAG: allophanate hydrolase subunit 1 [Pseudomonadota bacterium]
MASPLTGSVIRPCGEDAFVVEFGDTILPEHSAAVAKLTKAFDEAALPGVREVVPTFRSVLVQFDPDTTSETELVDAIGAEVAGEAERETRTFSIPVCLHGEMAEDIDEMAAELAMPTDDVRAGIVRSRLQVGMFGFAPGFIYLSGLDPILELPRRKSPRPPMPKGSMIIAAGMAGLSPAVMPTGWYVVGQTAVELWRPEQTPKTPFEVGDYLKVCPVDEATIRELAKDPTGGVEELRP